MFKQDSRTAKTLLTRVVTVICFLLAAVVVEGQQQTQDGAINTTRSNIKNTFPVDGKIDQLEVQLATVSESLSGRSKEPVITPVQLKNGKFELGILPAGEYELRVNLGGLSNQLQNLEGRTRLNFDPLILDLEGATGGTLKQELQLEKLDTKIDPGTARAGKPKFKNIVLRSDGKTPIKGTIRHDASMNSIRNLR